VKLHFAVNTETHEVVRMEVSTDDEHDVKELMGLVEESRRKVRLCEVSISIFFLQLKGTRLFAHPEGTMAPHPGTLNRANVHQRDSTLRGVLHA
jgi:hypothetical protein